MTNIQRVERLEDPIKQTINCFYLNDCRGKNPAGLEDFQKEGVLALHFVIASFILGIKREGCRQLAIEATKELLPKLLEDRAPGPTGSQHVH
ncbi:MAG: hypothetical protein JO283_13655 [Bradyrhizobium sp.]|nr:hypothetical protein [Bradyrhizobium sp.]